MSLPKNNEQKFSPLKNDMSFFTRNFLFVFIFCSLVCGQDATSVQNLSELDNLHLKSESLRRSIRQLEDRQDALILELSEISKKDSDEAERLGADVDRLFPCCPLADVERETFGMSPAYTFRTEESGYSHSANYLRYEDNQFVITDGKESHGFMVSVGKFPFEKAGEEMREFIALAKYQPPFEIENIKDEFVSDGIVFRRIVPVKIGETYILRAVNYILKIDIIYAVKVERQDADGSIIIFVKQIKAFKPPKMKKKPLYEPGEIYRTGLVIEIQSVLREQNFNDVQIEIAERGELKVKGFVPKGKTAEVIKIIEKIAPTETIKYELVEK